MTGRIIWKVPIKGYCQPIDDLTGEVEAFPAKVRELIADYERAGCRWADGSPVKRLEVYQDRLWKLCDWSEVELVASL